MSESERVARALGAGDTINIPGKNGSTKTYKLRPVSARQLCELERAALKYYKRLYLETYKENLDLLDGSAGQDFLEKKLEQVAKWSIDDCPFKDAHDVSKLEATPKLKEWAVNTFQYEEETEAKKESKEEKDQPYLILVKQALDNGQITPREVKKLSGKFPIRGRVRYDMWWVTGSFDGMVQMTKSALAPEHRDVSVEEISNWPFAKLIEAAQIADKLSAAALGNG